jgi:hypothetical protein
MKCRTLVCKIPNILERIKGRKEYNLLVSSQFQKAASVKRIKLNKNKK